jgi:DNA-binding CsgD family transcriptional regulator
MTAFEIVGRDEELAVVTGFLAGTDSLPRVLVIEGEPGIGKTTVWRHVTEEGRVAGYRVLTTRPDRSEAELAFAGLTDLLESSLDEVLPDLPPPQARALRVALLLDDPGATPADPRSVAAAVLGSLRHLARQESLLVAIDDVQWLDPSSAAALEFALRRLTDERIAVSLALRTDEASTSQLGVDEARTVRLRLQPLTLGALHRVLFSHLGLALPRPALRRVTEVSGGNPFFALELGRALQERGVQSGLHDPLPVPGSLSELLGNRLATLSTETMTALLVAALASEPTVPLVAQTLDASGWEQLRPAADRGVIALDGEEVCFTHPLLASAVEAEADLERRRQVHARLATVVTDPTSRARHLALATSAPNESIAAVVADAADHAAARGATVEAAQLADHAHRLTPPDEPDAALLRLVDAARKLAATGDTRRADALLQRELATLPPGPGRARVLSELADVESSIERSVALLRRALGEASGDEEVLMVVHLQLAGCLRITEDVWRAEAHAQKALAIAERLGDVPALGRALASLTLLRFNAGHGVDDALNRRLLRLEQRGALELTRSPRFDVAEQLVWLGRHDEARPLLEGLRDELRSRDDIQESEALWYLSFVELMAGRWTLAAEYSERFELLDEEAGLEQDAAGLWCRAAICAHRGEADAALKYGTLTLETVERTGARGWAAEGQGALGFLALSQADVREACDRLRASQEIWVTTGYLEPGMWLYGPDLVEACVALGELDEARAALELFEGRARALDRAHVLAQAARGRALIAAADGDHSEASAQIERALAEHARVRIPFHEARTYLALGSIERRRRHKRAARDALECALAEFERLGAPLWADRTMDELARVGGRAPSGGKLTPTERKVAELVAEGLATKEVASRLFVSPRTVDGHLAHIYAKLGVHSRAELGRHLNGNEHR